MTFLDNPWKQAEDAVFKALCLATSCEAKKSAFQGYLPPVGNVWALKVGGGGDVRNTWTAPITELLMHADIEGIWARLPLQDRRRFSMAPLFRKIETDPFWSY